MPTIEGKSDYLPGLDGVRAIAIGAVIIDHTFFGPFTGGGLGVDIFFVLSGFLITRLLLMELRVAGRLRLGRFYTRRALRLYPPLLIALALTFCLFLIVGDDYSTSPTWQALLVAGLYISNLVNLHQGYLVQTWSLGVEEQFYLFWPLALLLIPALRRSRWTLLALIVAFSVFRSVTSTGPNPYENRGLPWYCVDELLIGALLAVCWVNDQIPRWLAKPWVGAVVAACLVGAMVVTRSFTPYMLGGYTIFGLLVAVFIANLLLNPRRILSRALEWKPIAAVGQVSYGIYLFHNPIFEAVKHLGLSRIPFIGLSYSATAIVTVASWFLVERPINRFRKRWHAKSLASAKLASTPDQRVKEN
ncbi:acyltransferase family protein [uncultured Amnibacterium sp.]|uniref:acyltransferase family protein n=1 Tax=uncultured Amnibacterium sp. TaxID=1631851 RepID=UPI0035CA87D1